MGKRPDIMTKRPDMNRRQERKKKAQTTIVLLFLVIMIFGILFVFMLSFVETLSQEEYMETYLYNMLLSIVRTDTGYTDSNCKLVSDSLGCAFLQPTYYCGGGVVKCRDLATSKITYYIDKFETIKSNFKYFFQVVPQGFTPRDEQNMPIKFEIGDTEVEDADVKIVATYTIYKTLGTSSYIFKVRLYITRLE